MKAALGPSMACLRTQIGVIAMVTLLIAIASPEVLAQKKAKGKKGKKADAAQTETTPAAAAKPEDPTQIEARTRYANGKAAFEKGDFAASLVEFQAAYDAKPHPTVLKSIAECQASLGDLVGAISTLEGYLADEFATDKPEVQKRLDAIKAMLATVEVTSEPTGASISLDGRATGLSTPATVQVGAGTHTLTFELEQHETLARDVTVAKGDMSLVAVSLIPVTPPSEPGDGLLPYDAVPAEQPAASDDQGPPPAFWACAALTGLGLIGGAAFGTMALNDEDKWKSTGGTQGSVKESGQRNATIADVSFGVAIAAAVTGAIVLIVSNKKDKNEDSATDLSSPSISVVPVTNTNTIGLGAVVEF